MKYFYGLLIFLLIGLIVFFATPKTSQAANFGGLVLFSLPCTCSFGLWIIVGPPKPTSAIYSLFSSTLYKNFNPTIGHWVLGNTYTRTGVCLVYAGVSCVPVGGGLIINKIGTS